MMNIQAQIQLITKSFGKQKDVWSWAVKYGVVFIVFLGIYFPIQQRSSSYAANERSLKNQIANFRKISEGFLTPEEIEDLKKREEHFEAGITDSTKAAALIDQISNHAEKNHLNLIQIYSDSPVPIKNSDGTDLDLKGQKLSILPVSFRAEASYKDLANFLEALYNNSKEVYMVEAIHIQHASLETETLQCDMTLGYISK